MSTRCLVLVLALACCHKNDNNAPVPAPAPAPAAKPTLEIFVDDQSVARVDAAQLATWPRLDTLVPVKARRLGTWQDVSIKATAESTQLHKPSDVYRDLVPVVYVGDDGTPAFGMFDPVELANHGKPKVGEHGVSEIRITLAQGGGRGENESGQGGGSDPKQLKIAIKTPSGASTLEGTKLLAIARQSMPGDESKEPRGWTLATILDAAGIKKFKKIMLSDVSGQALSLEQADFDPNTSVPFVKLNRAGALRVTVFKKQGEGWQRAGDLRGLASIEVLE
ncbi:MAG: hypothetical protein ABI591_12425 [Kofleriaceae bacterium]